MVKKIELIPAILERNFSRIEFLVKKTTGLVTTTQIDICDGRLTPAKTFASGGCLESFKRLNKITNKVNLELDLIVDFENGPKGRGDKFLNSIKASKAKRVVFHFSGIKNWDKIFRLVGPVCEIGLGIWLFDDVRQVKKILEKYPFNYIQIMGIEKVGYGGQKLSNRVYGKIKYFHKNFPKLPIQVDGGVKVKNSAKLKKAGVTRLVSGSGFFEADNLEKRVKEFIDS